MKNFKHAYLTFAFLISGLLSASTNGYAQKPIALGITAGMNISTEDFSIQSDTNRTTFKGLILTGQTDWPLYGTAVLQDRLSYIQKGVVAHRSSLLLGSQTFTTELNYLELSLAPKIKFGLHDFKPYIFLGPRLGLLLSGNLKTEQGDVTSNDDIRTRYRALDFGLDMGAGFSYPVIPRLYFLADVGFGLGLTNILKQETSGTDQAFSRDLKIQAGFLLEAFDIDRLK